LADPDDPAEAAARLEQALERIAALSGRSAASSMPLAASPEQSERGAATTEIAARLDHLIAQIRATLDRPSEG
jgi:hypothetical protein